MWLQCWYLHGHDISCSVQGEGKRLHSELRTAQETSATEHKRLQQELSDARAQLAAATVQLAQRAAQPAASNMVDMQALVALLQAGRAAPVATGAMPPVTTQQNMATGVQAAQIAPAAPQPPAAPAPEVAGGDAEFAADAPGVSNASIALSEDWGTRANSPEAAAGPSGLHARAQQRAKKQAELQQTVQKLAAALPRPVSAATAGTSVAARRTNANARAVDKGAAGTAEQQEQDQELREGHVRQKRRAAERSGYSGTFAAASSGDASQQDHTHGAAAGLHEVPSPQHRDLDLGNQDQVAESPGVGTAVKVGAERGAPAGKAPQGAAKKQAQAADAAATQPIKRGAKAGGTAAARQAAKSAADSDSGGRWSSF